MYGGFFSEIKVLAKYKLKKSHKTTCLNIVSKSKTAIIDNLYTKLKSAHAQCIAISREID